jgi:hypothetical protein
MAVQLTNTFNNINLDIMDNMDIKDNMDIINNISTENYKSNVVNTNSNIINNNLKPLEYNNKIDVDLDASVLECNKFNLEFDLELMTSEALTAKQYLLIIPITKFFKNARNLYVLYNLLKCKTLISLRLIEYFVVNYVLEFNTCYDLNRYKNNPRYLIDNLFEINKKYNEYTPDDMVIHTNDDKNNFGMPSYNELFMIHDNYKCKLKEYNKKNFDPFCRWERVTLIYEKTTQLLNGKLSTIHEKSFETTVAQLNFFKWAIENHIIDYMTEYFDVINAEMVKFEDNTKLEKEQKSNKNKTKLDINEHLPEDIQLTQLASDNTDISKKTKKKEIVYCNADKKTIKKQRTKKEFTKTNKSIIKYNNEKQLHF